MKEPVTIGQRILAAVLAHQLGITTDCAMKLYVRGRELDPSWEQVGKELLKSGLGRSARRLCSGTASDPEKTDPREVRA